MRHSPARRRFLLAGSVLGGGLLVGYGLLRPRELLGERDILPLDDGEVALNAWLKLTPDGRVTVAVPRAEMGQGVHTALPMLVAEELDLPWSQVQVTQAPIDAVYANVLAIVDWAPVDRGDQGVLARSIRWTLARAAGVVALQITGSSTSVRDAWLPMRSAGAAARAMLIDAAAARLGVAAASLSTRDGQVVHEGSARALGYGELALEASRLLPPSDIVLKDLATPLHLGQPRQRLDLAAKVDGRARFGIDTREPDMLYAAIKASPIFGGRIQSLDTAALRALDGVVEVVQESDAAIVIATSWWLAQRALDRVAPVFDGGDAQASDAALAAAADALLGVDEGYDYEARGDADTALDGTADTIETQAAVPLLAHACMEPMNCTARVTASSAEIWCGNQAPDLLRMLAARRLDLPQDAVTVHTPYLGGGFGRRIEPDVMLRALAAARAVPGRCVQLIYSRQEDFTQDVYRPPAFSRLRARLDARGRIAAWRHDIVSPSVTHAIVGRCFPALPALGPDRTNVEGACFLPYAMPHRRVRHHALPVSAPVGYWRSVGHSFNAFFTETFIDELAAAAGQDPLAFRLAHLAEQPRHRAVLERLAELARWSAPLPAGHAHGLALHEAFHSIVGQVAEVALEDGGLRVHRVACVIDCGQVVQPDIVAAQMESGIVFGLSAALHGAAPLRDGRIALAHFGDYRLLGLADTPRIDVAIMPSRAAPGGVGETATPPIAPAVANAAARLLGRRLRSLPLRP